MFDDDPKYIFPIILLGDSGVGKTNIVYRYLNGENPPIIEETYGIKENSTHLRVGNDQILVKILDASGKKDYESSINGFRANVFGGFIVYDISKKDSFQSIDKWVEIFKNISSKNATLMLLGNKSDLNDKREIMEKIGEEKAKKLNISFFETSASNGENIDVAFNELLKNIFEKDEQNLRKDQDNEEGYTNEPEIPVIKTSTIGENPYVNEDENFQEENNGNNEEGYTNEPENPVTKTSTIGENPYVNEDENFQEENNGGDEKICEKMREKKEKEKPKIIKKNVSCGCI